MHATLRFVLPAITLACWMGAPHTVQAESLWQRFSPVDRVEADPKADYTLSDKNGPWLITAATFSGEGAERQARELALELRSRYNLEAFVHDMAFDYSGAVEGKGIDLHGRPMRMRYNRGEQVREFVVMVGSFAAIDDPRGQDLLKDIKTMHPEALSPARGDSNTQSLSTIRQWHNRLVKREAGVPNGPMRTAFMAPNPLLPKEYFAPQGVDPEVAKWNAGIDHGLLKAPGRYTVRVATFRGRGTLQGAASVSSSRARRKQAGQGEALVEAAENAHLLTEALRDAGWEAYEFHDRNESYVTIGSFDRVAERSVDGSETPTSEVRRIVETFGAAFNTPAEPLAKRSPVTQASYQVEEVKQKFNAVFASEIGQTASGLNPKFVQVEVESGELRPIPFDIQPYAMQAPKKTASSVFSWR